jgi:hypothetical protein
MNYWKSFKGFTVAELATTMGVIALAATILTPAVSGTVPASVEATNTTVSESSAAGKTPVTPPVTEILVTITNKTTGITLTKSVDPDAKLAEFTGLDAQADYDVTVVKRNNAGKGAASAVEIGYDELGTQLKERTRDIQVDDATKPIYAPDTTKPIYAQVNDTSRPIYQNQDRGYMSTRSVWVEPRYEKFYFTATCSEQVASTCSRTYQGQYCTGGTYIGYNCHNAACTSGNAQYSPRSCSTRTYTTSYSCTRTRSWTCNSWVWDKVADGYNRSEDYWVSNIQRVRVGYQQKTVVSSYETKITGYTQKTVPENFLNEEPVIKAVSKTAEVKAPTGQLIIEADSTPSRSWRWATGTIVGKGAGTSSNYTLDDSVSYRLGTPFTVSKRIYSGYNCHNVRCTSGNAQYTTISESFIRVPALPYLVR